MTTSSIINWEFFYAVCACVCLLYVYVSVYVWLGPFSGYANMLVTGIQKVSALTEIVTTNIKPKKVI
jgi:hypothetical protein